MVSVGEWIHAFILRMRVRLLKLKHGNKRCGDCNNFMPCRYGDMEWNSCRVNRDIGVAKFSGMCISYTPKKA